VFVVVIITLMSLMTAYDPIHIPFVGAICGKAVEATADAPACDALVISIWEHKFALDAPFIFTLLFTTFSVLWFCQVFPKRLAIRNSEKFLQQSSLLWPAIRLVGSLNIPGPADALVWWARRYGGYRQPRNLKPSRAAFYNSAVMLYGFSIDRVSVDIELAHD